MTAAIKVIVVDDSKFIRTLFTGLLSEYNDIEVIATAEDPYDAREKIKSLNPDVLTLDIEMPKMDGITFLEKIIKLRPMPVVMISSLTQNGADATLKALEIGAVDYIAKPDNLSSEEAIHDLGKILYDKIKTAASAKININTPRLEEPNVNRQKISHKYSSKKLIALGASTGGVDALKEVLIKMPDNCPPIVIVQHMPQFFTKMFADRVNKITEITVKEAEDAEVLQPGTAYIAEGGKQMEIRYSPEKGYYLKVYDGAPVSGHKPSVNCLFDSVAKYAKNDAIAALLTGMGRDGADGTVNIKNAGGYTIAQNKETCTVFGMPKAAIEQNGICVEKSIHDIADTILEKCL